MARGRQIWTATLCTASALSMMIAIAPPAWAYFTSGAEITAVKPVINSAVFNDPIGTVDQQSAIITQLERLIDSVPAGEEIQGSVFEFGHLRIANRLIAAYDRGARVKLIVDPALTGNAAYTAVRDRLGGDETVGSWVVVCNDQFPTQHRGCIGTRVITYSTGPQYAYNHNKFFLFSRLAFDDGTGASNVVWQSSSNLSSWYEVESYNDSVTFSDSPVYNAYRQYFADLRSYRYSFGGNHNYYWGTPSGSTYRERSSSSASRSAARPHCCDGRCATGSRSATTRGTTPTWPATARRRHGSCHRPRRRSSAPPATRPACSAPPTAR